MRWQHITSGVARAKAQCCSTLSRGCTSAAQPSRPMVLGCLWQLVLRCLAGSLVPAALHHVALCSCVVLVPVMSRQELLSLETGIHSALSPFGQQAESLGGTTVGTSGRRTHTFLHSYIFPTAGAGGALSRGHAHSMTLARGQLCCQS